MLIHRYNITKCSAVHSTLCQTWTCIYVTYVYSVIHYTDIDCCGLIKFLLPNASSVSHQNDHYILMITDLVSRSYYTRYCTCYKFLYYGMHQPIDLITTLVSFVQYSTANYWNQNTFVTKIQYMCPCKRILSSPTISYVKFVSSTSVNIL